MRDAVKNLQIGDILQLQHAPPSENADRYAVRLVGYLPDQSLVISTPRKHGKAILVTEGHAFTVRLLRGSNIFGFGAKVLSISSKPYPHLHLSYPQAVESAVVRNAPRAPTKLSALVENISHQEEKNVADQTGIILDLSITGARLLLTEKLGEVGDRVQIMLSLEVCGGEDRLRINGTIRSIRELSGGNGDQEQIYGIQFAGLNRFQQILLCAFVSGQFLREKG